MSTISDYLDTMTDDSLRGAAEEIFEWHNTGILINGIVRAWSALICLNFEIDIGTCQHMVERYVMERCARNYLDGKIKCKKNL